MTEKEAGMELSSVGAVRVFEKWALGLCLSPNPACDQT